LNSLTIHLIVYYNYLKNWIKKQKINIDIHKSPLYSNSILNLIIIIVVTVGYEVFKRNEELQYFIRFIHFKWTKMNFVFEVPGMSLQDAYLECEVDVPREFLLER
jgi:hypothetical protein